VLSNLNVYKTHTQLHEPLPAKFHFPYYPYWIL
jgi:hypothetical protein